MNKEFKFWFYVNGSEVIRIVNEALGKERTLLYLTISGSHIWGLERPDSDIDVRGIYLDPTEKFLGLLPAKLHDTVEFKLDYQGATLLDGQLYELGKFLRLLCKSNGNMVHLLRIPQDFHLVKLDTLPWLELANAFTTRKLRHYYRGYAESQRKRSLSQRGGKALIYTYREMFEGLHVMKYGCMEFDFKRLWQKAVDNGWYSKGLLDRYFPDPYQEITDEGWSDFYDEWEQLCEHLDTEVSNSSLPDSFDGQLWCNELLYTRRLLDLGKEGK